MRMSKINFEAEETLAEAMERFMKVKEAQNICSTTKRDYHHFLNDFLNFSSNSLDEETIKAEVLTYFSNIPDTSPARYNHPYQTLSAFFNWAIKQNDIPLNTNPLTSQGLHKKKDDGNIKPASIDDIKTLLKSFDKTSFSGFRNYIITMLILDTGIRTSELRRLKDSDFDANAKQIIVSKQICKTRKNRVIYLSDTTAKMISKFIKIKPQGFSDLIFPTVEGKELTCTHLANEFDKQCQKAGVKFTPYQLRHSFASYFIANGGNVFTLQNLMGHADLRMTKRYVEIDEQQKQQAHATYSPLNALQGANRIIKI